MVTASAATPPFLRGCLNDRFFLLLLLVVTQDLQERKRVKGPADILTSSSFFFLFFFDTNTSGSTSRGEKRLKVRVVFFLLMDAFNFRINFGVFLEKKKTRWEKTPATSSDHCVCGISFNYPDVVSVMLAALV